MQFPRAGAESFSEDRPLGWDPAAAGSRAGDGMARLVSEEKASAHPGDIHLRQLLGRYGLCTVERLCALCAALQPQNAPDCALAAQRARQLEADGVCCRVSQLAVNGRDLMAAGIPSGPALGAGGAAGRRHPCRIPQRKTGAADCGAENYSVLTSGLCCGSIILLL